MPITRTQVIGIIGRLFYPQTKGYMKLKLFLLLILLFICSCSGFKVGVYGERIDTIETKSITTAPKLGLSDAVYDWLFVNHDGKHDA